MFGVCVRGELRGLRMPVIEVNNDQTNWKGWPKMRGMGADIANPLCAARRTSGGGNTLEDRWRLARACDIYRANEQQSFYGKRLRARLRGLDRGDLYDS